MSSYTEILLIVLVIFPLRSEPQGLCSRQLDIALIIDQSGSILTDASSIRVWQDSIIEFAAGLVHVLPIGPDMVQLGVVKFSTNARVAINLDEYEDRVSLELAVRDLEYGGGETNIAAGLSVARDLLNDSDLGARNGVQKVAILISDGRANIDKSRTQPEGNSTKAAGVEIFSVGVTNLTNEAELKGIASSPTATHYYLVSDRDVLNKTLTSILTELCTLREPLPSVTVFTITSVESTASRNSTGPTSMSTSTTLSVNISTISSTHTSSPNSSTIATPQSTIATLQSTIATPQSTIATPQSTTPTPQSTTPTLQSTIATPQSTIATPQSTTPAPQSTTPSPQSTTATPYSTVPPPICSQRADIVLIIDKSRDETLSGYSWYDFVRAFSIGIINALPIAPYMVRLGVVTYNTVAYVDISLGQYMDAASLERAIGSLQLQSGDRNTADGLDVGRNVLFNNKGGARSGIPKVAFLITNGQPSINRDLTQWEANLTKSAGVEIFSIGVTNQVNEIELRLIASIPTATHYYFESNYNSVNRLINAVLVNYCSPSKVTPASSVVSTASSTLFFNSTRQQDIPVNMTDILTTATTATTQNTASQSISATTPGTTTSTTQNTSTSNITQTTPNTNITANQSTSTSATPFPLASTTQIASISSSTSSTISSTTRTSTTPTTSTSTIQLSTTTAAPNTSTAAALPTQSTLTTSGTPTTTITSTLTTSTTSPVATTSTHSSPNTPTTTTTTTTPSTSISTIPSTSSTTTIPVTSTTQSTSVESTSTGSASPTESTTDSSTDTTESTTPTTTVIPCPKEIDIVLILDETTSIVAAPGGYDNWYGYILGFAAGFVNVFQVDPAFVRIGVIKFSSSARVVITLDQYGDAASLVEAVRGLEIYGGETNIAAGLRVGRSLLFNASLGARVGAKKMAFLVTDGRANVEHDVTSTEVNITKTAGVEIYCIGVTSMIDEVELRNIASTPISTHYYFVTNYDLLNQVLGQLRGTICFALQITTVAVSGKT